MSHAPLAVCADDLTGGRTSDWREQARSAGTVSDQPISLEGSAPDGQTIVALALFIEIDH